MSTLTQKRKAGVTLVELLCAITIIVILVALSLGPIFKALHHANKVLGN